MLRATLFALAAASAITLPAFANGLSAEQSVERALVSIDANGNEVRTYTLADEVAPGDEVRYSLSYANTGSEAAEAVSLVMPVPSEVTYIEASASGAAEDISFSADGGNSFASRATVTVRENGQVRPAAPGEITHIKWTFSQSIAPSDIGRVSFSAVLK